MHFWVDTKNGENIAYLGLSDFFQQRIGELNQLILREQGKMIKKKKTMGIVKAMNYSAILKNPTTFKILEVNNEAVNKPIEVNANPYQAWLYKVEFENLHELDEWLVTPEDPRLQVFLEKEIKNNALLGDDCCPDFLGADVKKKQEEEKKKKKKPKEVS